MHNTETLVGETLNDRYKILEKIGTGGMAIVYKAHDGVLDRDVAVKVLRQAFDSESAIVSNFIKEARSSASLVHPNVVSVYDVCEHGGFNYMVMELVDGKTLKEYIKKNPRLPWHEACNYAIQIGQGIQAAHERNIIHRDIKPQNIIMDSSGTLKVTDFGIAKAVEGDKAIAGGTAMGSVHYISAEQARGGFTDFRSDIYSLGVVLYEMLAGRVPFDGDDPVSVALMHIESEPINVKCVNMDIPSDLAYVTMKAMNREPGKRYQKIQDFLEDLRAVLADESLPSKEKDRFMNVEFDDNSENTDTNKSANATHQREMRVREKGREKVVKKKSEKNAILLAFATAAALVMIGLGMIFLFANPFSETVPDLVNMSVKEAEQSANRHGYDVELEYTYSDLVPKDMIIAQFPSAGEELDKQDKIILSVSMGATGGKTEVPDVTGISLEEAKREIEALRLVCEVDFVDSDKKTGIVVRQTPSMGTHMNPAGKVKLFVSSGSKSSVTEETKAPQKTEEAKPNDADKTDETVNDDNTQTTQKPTATNPPSEADLPSTMMYSVKIPDDAGETVHVKIVANGNVLHNSTHSKSEGKIVQQISGSGAVKIQTYIDGVLIKEESVNL